MDEKKVLEMIKREVRFETSGSSGPGGQNVNKRNTKVMALWNFSTSKLIGKEEKEKIASHLRSKVNVGRVLILSSQKFRSQNQNKKDVIATMARLVTQAIRENKKRIATVPSAMQEERRLKGKRAHSRAKNARIRKPEY